MSHIEVQYLFLRSNSCSGQSSRCVGDGSSRSVKWLLYIDGNNTCCRSSCEERLDYAGVITEIIVFTPGRHRVVTSTTPFQILKLCLCIMTGYR